MIDSVENITQLKAYGSISTPPVLGSLVCMKWHTDAHDGGGGFFIFNDLETRPDNNGTIIKSDYVNQVNGMWIRQFNGYIDVRFFGASGQNQPGDGSKIQDAIDAAAYNVTMGAYSKGTTVFVPSGGYMIAKPLILKNGVSIIGDGIQSTLLRASYPPEEGATNDGYMMELDKGVVSGCNIANLQFVGNVEPKTSSGWDPNIVQTRTKGCINFVASGVTEESDGGLWNSTIKNICITQFNGPGINLIGGTDYHTVHQCLVFENIIVRRQKNYVTALKLENEIGQLTFINAGFDGIIYGEKKDEKVMLGHNIEISTGNIQLAVISFINSTIQGSESGVYIKNCESITFDTCWFEALNLAITAEASADKVCKAINVMNSRFANAAGFGSRKFTNMPGATGRAITSNNAEVNVVNNYVTVSDIYDESLPNKYFIVSFSPNKGVHTLGNSFQIPELGHTSGMNQVIVPEIDPSSVVFINLRDSISVYVNSTNPSLMISKIISSVCPGEIITIRANVNPLAFDTSGNIFLSGQSSVSLNNGDIATFVKFESDNDHIYHLISIFKSTTVT